MPIDPPVDLLDFAGLISRMEAVYLGGGGGSGDGAGGVGQRDIGKVAGVYVDGSAVSSAAAIQALVTEVRSEFVDATDPGNPKGIHAGREIVGYGKRIRLNEAVDFRNANVDLFRCPIVAEPGFAGTLIKSGRAIADANTRLSVPHSQRLSAWGGDGIKNEAVTLFHIDSDTAPGGEYKYIGSYAGRGALISGNFEKKRIAFSFSYVSLACEVAETSTGSADSVEIDIRVVNYSRLLRIVYNDVGADLSLVMTGQIEGYRGINASANHAVHVEIGKAILFNWTIRGFDGLADNAFYYFDQTQNDYADTIGFGTARHIAMNGQLAYFKSVRRLYGTLYARDTGDAWTSISPGDSANGVGPRVPKPLVQIGAVIDAGGFHLDLVGVGNATAVQVGDDNDHPIDCDFGSWHVSCGAFKPPSGDFPFGQTAVDFYKAERCSFAFSQVHGKLVIRSKILDCVFAVPSTWLNIGYAVTIESGAVFTLIVKGPVTWAQARATSWLGQVSGEQMIVFASISDKGGVAATYSRGNWTLATSHVSSAISLAAAQSDINRDFYVPGLESGNSDDGKGYSVNALPIGGGRVWREGGGGTITVGLMAATAALFARLGTPGTAYANIYDRLIYQLVDMGADTAWVGGGLLCMETHAQSLRSLLPSAATGTWYDATVASGAPAWTAKQGFMMDPNNADRISTGYAMTAAAEGLTRFNMLALVAARRENPGYGGSQNLYDMAAANGRLKLRTRDNARSYSVGTQSTPATAAEMSSRMPQPAMAGRVDVGIAGGQERQFGVDLGRVANVHALSAATGVGSSGDPDLMSLSGSRELWCWAILKASHFFVNDGGTIRPIGDRALRLHRAFLEAYQAVRAIP